MDISHFHAQLSTLLGSVVLPETNQVQLQRLLAQLYVGKLLAGAAKAQVDPATKALRAMYDDRLQQPMPLTTLVTVRPFTLSAKVDNPRETFDKSAFIKAVAAQYNLSAIDLHSIAADCTKQSAAPVSISVDLE